MEQSNFETASQGIDARAEELLRQLTLREKVALLSGADAWHTVAIERLGIPSLIMTDGPHGVRSNRAEAGRIAAETTAFPTGVSMAASWNPALIERVGAALADETHAMGCDILLGPCVNIVRHPLAGRNFEAYSEDPYLAGRIGVGWVKGLQSRQAGASLKHFACNNQEIERGRGNSIVDERTLREIYLAQFETIVKEAQPWTVMCSYNRINGAYASQNHTLLKEILKGEWAYDGAVVSDWGANHTIAESVHGGLDIEMPGPAKYYGNLLVEAVQNWQIDEADVDDAARRMLRLVLRSGRMAGQSHAGVANTLEHQSLAREVAEEAITLLQNERGVLPLHADKIETMAVIGPNAAEARVSGGGSSQVEPPYRVSPLEGLRRLLGDRVEIRYEQGCDNTVELPLLKVDNLTPPTSTGHGMRGQYFTNATFSGQPAVERIDTLTDFWWYGSGPAEGIPIECFSVRWSARISVPESGLYRFKLVNTANCRLLLDGVALIDHTRSPEAIVNQNYMTGTAEIDLVAGTEHDFTMEFAKYGGDTIANVRLMMARVYRPGDDNRLAHAVELAAQSDVAVIFAGMPAGYESEGADRPDIELPGAQNELIRAVVAANRNTIVVLNAGAAVSMPWLAEVPVVVEAYYPGMEGGHAIARILMGEVNPSGKLPVTFPARVEDTPAFNHYPGARDVRYEEGIFVGYRHYEQHNIQPLFPFGHGLSYTTFEYRDLQAPPQVVSGESVPVSLIVKNTGQYAGKEVVQLYVRDIQSSLPRPPKELKAFAKLSLAPGEEQKVSFTLDTRSLSFYDPARKQWVAEPGEFEVLAGSSSRDIRVNTTLVLQKDNR
jgi:beta-glucosidase